MRTAFASAFALAFVLSGAAFAQSPSRPGTGSALTPQQIKSELEAAGFNNIAVTASAYAVRATTPDGTPVSITFNPQQLRTAQPDSGLGPG